MVGFGLSGELGTSISLISETLPIQKRGKGTMIVCSMGGIGAMTAGLMAKHLGWRVSLVVGGCLGLSLLFLRVATVESGLFQKLSHDQRQGLSRDASLLINTSSNMGNITLLFRPARRLLRYVRAISHNYISTDICLWAV